jgi:D-arabinose 1-dehydrogenase-like Zn-dependent alcohol dehydrogenase
MRAMVVSAFGAAPELRELPDPVISDGDVLLKVMACGVCHTDLKVRDGLVPNTSPPIVLGHEAAGEVVAVGSGVTGIAVGDRGVPYGYETCGTCIECRCGRDSLCESLSGRLGFDDQGGQCELIRVPARLFLKIDPRVTFQQAAVTTCSMVTPYRGMVRRARVRVGETVVVVGAGGGLGLHAVQIARLVGATVIAIDSDTARTEAITQQGADHVVITDGNEFSNRVRSILGGRGADVIVDLVGSTASIGEGIEAVRNGGRVVVIGYRAGQLVQVGIPDLVFREIELYGCHWASIVDLIEVLDLVAQGALSPVISHAYPLEQAAAALDDLEGGRIFGRAALVI